MSSNKKLGWVERRSRKSIKGPHHCTSSDNCWRSQAALMKTDWCPWLEERPTVLLSIKLNVVIWFDSDSSCIGEKKKKLSYHSHNSESYLQTPSWKGASCLKLGYLGAPKIKKNYNSGSMDTATCLGGRSPGRKAEKIGSNTESLGSLSCRAGNTFLSPTPVRTASIQLVDCSASRAASLSCVVYCTACLRVYELLDSHSLLS